MIDARPKKKPVVIPVKPAERSCGDCTLCCKVMGIDATWPDGSPFVKAKDVWCVHAKSHRGCGV